MLQGCSFITSLPDVSETSMQLRAWRSWFVSATELILNRCPPEGVAIFYQTDIKHEGTWVDKGYLCLRGAENVGAALLWHKIVCRREPGAVTFGRPSYAHLLCFSRGLRVDPAQSTADVLPSMGHMTWARAMGIEACGFACRFVHEHTATRTVVDPFCGVGTVLAVANALGLDAIGVERHHKRAVRSRDLHIPSTAVSEARRKDPRGRQP